ncbi:hypothetical protein THAR02_08606 [Trichoderma harzianum]|uniref:Uncharacterized protein n=1 Tax=Trichoderma harzianum TaxID=5544 RepID=A0A0F9X236_TRIHA|nr:hypothetical protein THAR02_08606 [Trichoderma harzianum]
MSDKQHTAEVTADSTSDSHDDSYFDLSVRSLPCPPPYLLLTLAPPSTSSHEPPRSTPWDRAMQDGAFTNSNSPAGSPDRKRAESLSTSGPKFGVDPPRPPREGYESTKSASETDALLSGRLASRVTSATRPKSKPDFPRHDPPAIHQVWTPYLSEFDHVFSLQHPTAEPVSPSTAAITPSKSQQSSESIVVSPGSKSHRLFDAPKTTSPEIHTQTTTKTGSPTPLLSPRLLYLKAKKEIESKLKQKQHEDSYIHSTTNGGNQTDVGLEIKVPCNDLAPDEDCRTRSTVEGARKFLASQNISKTGTWFKDEFHTSKIGRKLFGRAPWHRKESGDSITSVSSSIRAVLKGKTPPASPATLGLSHTSRYNLSHSTFPGGEAIRVSTPPLDEDTADGRPRAFFTSLTPPKTSGETNSKTASPSNRSVNRYSIHSSSMASQSREWWEQAPPRGSRREISVAMGTSTSKFEFDVPEHLPSSPMCPANKRHKSGGTGVCVYHGRRKTKSVLRDEMSRAETTEYSSADNG